MSAYRIVDGLITRVTDEVEIAAIEAAGSTKRGAVRAHLHRALQLLSDRAAPDYRNSIKESISAVESLAAMVTNSDGGTLGQLIKTFKEGVDLHPALEKAITALYGYTSDEGGIRHALMDKERVDFADAKFMLVVCSAFVNFVQGKSSDAK